jgi:hypothetical protein
MEALEALVKEVPYLGAVCLFGYLMLRILQAEAAGFREILKAELRELAVAIGRVDERTAACIRGDARRPPQ